MQTVIHDYINVSPIFDQIEYMYGYISDKPEKTLFSVAIDESFSDLCDTCGEYIKDFKSPKLIKYNFPELVVKHSTDNIIIVCVSGGKDSVALVKYMLSIDYDVVLYHMRGINKVYSDEYKAVIDIAKYFNIPYYIDTVVLSGTQRFTEHPMKNMIIANGAIHYGLRENIGVNIAFGNFNESYLDGNQFEVCAGDCMDLWCDYEKIIRSIIPNFSIRVPFHNNAQSLEIIEQDEELLRLSVSCMSPYRFREYWKQRTEKKYGVELLPNRCGCCWKCCMEYMYYSDHGTFDFNLTYYLHCLQILCDTLRKESKVTGTIQQLWDEYMHYPIEESKAWEVLKNATIQNGKIRCVE